MTNTKHSESSGSESANGSQATTTPAESSNQPLPTEGLPTKLAPEEEHKFFWFVKGVEIGVCTAAGHLKQQGRKDLFLQTMHLLDSKDHAQLVAEMFWQLYLENVKSGSKTSGPTWQDHTSTIDTIP